VYKAPRVGNKGETSAQGTQSGKQGGDKCKLMRRKEQRVGDKYGRQMWETSDKWETSVNSCDPRHPEWETRGKQV